MLCTSRLLDHRNLINKTGTDYRVANHIPLEYLCACACMQMKASIFWLFYLYYTVYIQTHIPDFVNHVLLIN